MISFVSLYDLKLHSLFLVLLVLPLPLLLLPLLPPPDPVPFTASYHPTSSTNSSTISSSTTTANNNNNNSSNSNAPSSSSSSSYDTPSYSSCVLISENNEDKFSCRICGASFSSARECNHHVDENHAQEVAAQLKVKCNKVRAQIGANWR